MASITFRGRMTRSSSLSPQVTPKQSPSSGRYSNTEGRCRAKRRMVYPDENPSPAKKLRSSDWLTEEGHSPIKVKAKSFYGRTTGAYLNPLDRKEIFEKRRLKALNENKPVPEKVNLTKAAPTVPQKTQKKAKGKKTKGVSPRDVKTSKPLADELDQLGYSPIKNKIKVDTRVYSPSRKDQKFFKSRRSTPHANKPAAVVQKRRGLQVTYQPRGISTKSKETAEKPSFLLNPKFISPNLPKRTERSEASPVVDTRSVVAGPAARSSPVKKPLPKPVRKVIHSSKNPHSPDLFSPSDWDFGDDDDEDTSPSQSSLPETLASATNQNVDQTDESTQLAEGSCSIETDSINLLTEPSEQSSRCTSPGSSTSENYEPSEGLPEARPKKVFDIFKARARSESSSNRSSPMDNKRRLSLRNSGSNKKLKSLIDKDGKEQMTLDFGQTLKGAVQCESCGMTYNHGEPSDEAMHKKFHERVLAVLRFPGWKKETVLQEFGDGSRIIVVMPDEKIPMKKVLAVKKIVDDDLGFVIDSSVIGSNSKTFMFISEDKRIVGFCVAETVSKAYRALTEEEQTNSTTDGGKVKPWCCSTKPEKVRCGINRIWVLGTERRRNVASKLIDCVRANFLLGFPMRKIDLAFTDPTPDGRAFATRYIGTPSFLVYKH